MSQAQSLSITPLITFFSCSHFLSLLSGLIVNGKLSDLSASGDLTVCKTKNALAVTEIAKQVGNLELEAQITYCPSCLETQRIGTAMLADSSRCVRKISSLWVMR